MKYKILVLLSYLTLLSATILMLYFSYILFYPFVPCEFKDENYKVLTPVVKRGGNIVFEGYVCKKMNVSATVCSQLIDTYIYFYPEMTGNIPIGCANRTVVLPIPDYISSGEYYVRTIYKYQINKFREIRYVKDTEKFLVEGDEPEKDTVGPQGVKGEQGIQGIQGIEG